MVHVIQLIFLHITCLHILHATESSASSPKEVTITGGAGTVAVIGENVKCNGVILHSGKVKDLMACWMICEHDIKCRFVVWWFKSKKCETYETCPSTIPVSQRTSLMRKITECEVQRGLDRQGPYIHQIASQFAENAIRTLPPNQNLWCQCVSNTLMICGIFLESATKEDGIVRARLDRSDTIKLRPFFVSPAFMGQSGLQNDRLLFDPSSGLGDERVSAEIQIMSSKNCIPMRTCVQGDQGPMCPITKMHMQSGDPIYVLKQDSRTIESKKPKSVLCLSLPGLRTLASLPESAEKNGFIDPFKRMKGARLQIETHYEMYFIFTEELLDRGLCEMAGSVHNEEFPRGSFSEPKLDLTQERSETPDQETDKGTLISAQNRLAEEMVQKLDELAIKKPRSVSRTQMAMSFRHRNPSHTIPVFSPPTSPNEPSVSTGSAKRSDFRPFKTPQSPPQYESLESEPFDPPPIGTKCLAILHPEYPEKDLPSSTTGTVVEHLFDEKLLKIQLMNGETMKVPVESIIMREDILNMVSPAFLAEGADPPTIDKSNPVWPSIGSQWMVRGFPSTRELNGQICRVMEVDKKKGKIKVKVELEDGTSSSSPGKDTFTVKLQHLVPPEIKEELCTRFAQESLERVKEQIRSSRATSAFKEKQSIGEDVVRASMFSHHSKIMFFIFPFFTYCLLLHFYKPFTSEFYISLDSDADEI